MYADRYTHTLTYRYMRKPGDIYMSTYTGRMYTDRYKNMRKPVNLLCNVRYSPSSHTHTHTHTHTGA